MNNFRYSTGKILLFSTMLGIACSSCNNFLDRQKQGEQTSATYFNSEKNAIASINAAYSDLKDYRLDWSDWAFGETLSDNSIYSGDDGDSNGFEPLKGFNGTSGMSLVENRWKIAYRGINKSSQAIEGIEAMDDAVFTTPGLKKRLLAEAHFLRAYYHFELVRSYGKIPIIDHWVTSPNDHIKQSEVADVYQFIISELLLAEPDLPKKSQYAAQDLGRITQGAVDAYLAKCYLYTANWTACIQWCDKLIASGEYGLAPDFAQMFSLAGEHGIESIFEISMINSPTETGATTNNGNFQTLFQLPRNITYGYGINQPTMSLYNAFMQEKDSVRMHATLLTTDEVYHIELAKLYQDSANAAASGDPAAIAQANVLLNEGKNELIYNRTGFYNKKSYLGPSERATSMRNNPNNIRLMRYAEVILMDAEAKFQNHDEGAALTLLNQLRVVRKLAPKIVSGPALLGAIYTERHLELAMENDRYYDLVRTNRASILPSWTDARKYWPIPQSVINTSNGDIVQNPGYN